MPEFLHQGKIYYNPVEFLMAKIGGAWKMPILWRLKDHVFRYGELKKDIPHISDKMLTKQLRELEKDGFIHREVFSVIPPKTEYTITEKGRSLIPLIEHIRQMGLQIMDEEGVKE